MAYKLIATDLDGTLLNSEKQISAYAMNILRKAHDRGIIIVPITGRQMSSVPFDSACAEVFDYLIDNNGSSVYDSHLNIIHEELISTEDALAVTDYLMSKDVYFSMIANEISYRDNFYSRVTDEYLNMLYRNPQKLASVDFTDSIYRSIERHQLQPQKFFVILKHSFQMNGHQALKEIKARFPDLAITTSLPDNYEVNALLATKGFALKYLCHYLDIDLKDVVVFGDNDNDLSSLGKAGLAIAPKNATKEAKRVADIITDSNDNDGVAKAIERYVL